MRRNGWSGPPRRTCWGGPIALNARKKRFDRFFEYVFQAPVWNLMSQEGAQSVDHFQKLGIGREMKPMQQWGDDLRSGLIHPTDIGIA